MIARPRRGGWRGRKRWAWVLYAVALVAMTIGLFLPSYGSWAGFGNGTDLVSYPGWECAWTVTWIWGNVIESGFKGLSYDESVMLSYLPINALFLLSPCFLWLTGRSRHLGWVFRVIYTLIVFQVLAWWVLHLFENGGDEEILIGYWFWLGAYVLLAAAFWMMARAKPTTVADLEVHASDAGPD